MNPAIKHTKARGRKSDLILLPGAIYLVLFFIVPLIYLLRYSLYQYNAQTLFTEALTLENYISFFQDPYYKRVFLQSFGMAFAVSLISVVLAYPVAYYLVRVKSKLTHLLSAIVYLPLLASSVVTSFGWMILLSDTGLINRFLLWTGVVEAPIKMMYSMLGVGIALTQAYLPFMIISIRNVLYTVDRYTEEAAQTLGATPAQTLLRITLPLSLSGIAAGMLLVFVGVLSAFVTPQLIGGGKINTLASVILREAQVSVNWPMAAAISFVLLLVAGVALFLQNKLLESKLLGGGGRQQ